MYSLFYVLTNQHADEFESVRCNAQTVKRLVRYFEDVITENKLSGLVVQGRCLDGRQPARESERTLSLSSGQREAYLFCCNEECPDRTWSAKDSNTLTVLEERDYHSIETGPFILAMDHRFCGLLASRALPQEEGSHLPKTYEMIWSFGPNVVFTALEYFMSRINVQRPNEIPKFQTILNSATTHSPSLALALTLTTKLSMLMQRQTELEMATNRISSAISSTLELESILQAAVEEVGRALKARRAALVLWQEGSTRPEGMSVYERPEQETPDQDAQSEIPTRPSETQASVQEMGIPGPIEIPVTYRNSVIGVLAVEDDTPGRHWEDEEELMVRTVSDQLAVAISHARLFRQVQTQAMTDALTSLYNHRYFQERLEREIKLCDRNNDRVSLILLDLDHLKKINDNFGHRTGDAALIHVARLMVSTVRDVDICARYGGEEFVIILPQCGREDAINVAERLREAIAATPVHKIGQVTASIGVATYPAAARTKEELIEMADRAMYLAKAAGRNRVRTLMHRSYTDVRI